MNLISIGFLFGGFYWIMESVRDVIGLERGTFFERLLHPDSRSFWMRLMVVLLLLLFGVIAESLRNLQTVTVMRSERKFRIGGMVWAGFLFTVLYWFLESFRDFWTFDKGDFVHCLFIQEPVDIAMRLMGVSVILLFSAYAQSLIDERNRAEITLKKTQRELELLVRERTQALSESNRLLKQEIRERAHAEKELRKVNRALKTLSECNEVLVRAAKPEQLLKDICQKLVDVGGYPLVWVDIIKKNGKSTVETKAKAAAVSGDLKLIRNFHAGSRHGIDTENTDHDVIEPVVHHDLVKLAVDTACIRKLKDRRYCAWTCIPLVREGKAFGALHILDTHRKAFDREALRLLNELANNLAFGLTVIKTRQEREIAEKEKEQFRAQLLESQKMEAVGILAGGVAHDFNNLLTAIQVSVDLALMDANEDTSIYRELIEIHQVADHASQLARQLLLFSRKHPMEPAAILMNNLVGHVRKMLIRLTGENIRVLTELETDLWHIWADQATIEQVIINLVVNARDAMENGGDLTIATENVQLSRKKCRSIPESRPGKFVMLKIKDTGTGMPDETLNRIFEPFFSTKAPGKGSGLGLSVVYGIVKEHDGFIHVESVEGRGTCFSVYLPAVTYQVETKIEREVCPEQLNGHGRRILIIEDEDKVREFTCKGLQMNGYEVFTASSGIEAEMTFDRERGRFDAILSDVVLPDTSGINLSDRLRKKRAGLKVLLCSGYADEGPSVESQRNGTIYLQKPYSLTDVLKKLHSLMDA
ncbi:response regulator [bacterium]|nr:response regulator [bacterium]